MPAVSPAARNRADLHDQALDADRRATRHDLNRDQADQQLEPSHGDPPRSRNTPNTRQRPDSAMNPYTPSPEQQAAADEALARAIRLIYQPLTFQQRRQLDRDTARARGLLLAWEQMGR